MVLEPCSEVGCPCCYFEYTFEYENYGNGYVTITNIIHVTDDLEYQCANVDCCFSCAGAGQEKWVLDEKSKLYNYKEIKCKP